MPEVVLGLSYGVLLWMAGMWATAGGHGTFLPAMLFAAPLTVLGAGGAVGGTFALFGAPVNWAIFGSLVALRRRGQLKRAAPGFLVLHYAAICALLLGLSGLDTRHYRLLVSMDGALFVWPAFALYLWGQVVVWRDGILASGTRV